MKRLFLLPLFLCFFQSLSAQFYVSMEGGTKWDVVQCFATKGTLSFQNSPDFIGGASLGFVVNPYVSLEIGAYVHQLNNRYQFKLDGVRWLNEEIFLPAQFLQFPFRLRTKLFTINDLFFIEPYLGVSFLLHRHKTGNYELHTQQTMIDDPSLNAVFSYVYAARLQSNYAVLGEAGVSMRYQVSKYFSASLSFGFTVGASTIHEANVTWERDLPAFQDEGWLNAQYKGDYFSLNLGVQCIFNQ